MKTNKYVVTGATGFVGSKMLDLLDSSESQIVAVSRKQPKNKNAYFIQQDFGKDFFINERKLTDIDYIFHLAGIAHSTFSDLTWDDYYQVNVLGTKQLCELAGKNGVKKFIFVSSIKASSDPGVDCVNETWNMMPSDHYGKSKYLAELAVKEISEKYNMDYVIIRPTLVYGPNIKGNLLKMIQAIDNNRFPPIPKMTNKRSLVHVEDLCRALILVAKSDAANGNTYIVSDSNYYSTREIYEAMMSELGKPLGKITIPKFYFNSVAVLGDILENVFNVKFPLNSSSVEKLFGSACYDSTKISEQLGFQPKWTLESAMPQIIESYRKSSKI